MSIRLSFIIFKKTKRVLFVENKSDAELLSIFAEKLNTPISGDVVV